MRFLVISQYYYPETFRINDICAELVRLGHSVTVVTGQPNYPQGKIYNGYEKVYQENIKGVNVIRCKIRPRKTGTLNLLLNYVSYAISASLKVRTIKEDYDMVFVYQLSPVFMAIPAIKFCKRHKLKSFMYCCDIWPESILDVFKNKNGLAYAFTKRLSSNIYKQMDLIAVKSPSFRSYLKNVCGIDYKKTLYIPEHAEDIYLSMDSGYVDNDIVDFMFLGNIGKSQNCVDIIKAASLFKDRKDYLIHFVGDGSSVEELKEAVNRFEMSDRVIFHGKHSLEEMPRFYKIADVCLLTLADDSSIGLTIPGKLIGYMAAGKAVVAEISGDAQDIIKEANCGYCVDAGNIEGFSNIMLECLNHKEDLRQMGMNGKNYFCQNHTKAAFVDRFLESINPIINEKA